LALLSFDFTSLPRLYLDLAQFRFTIFAQLSARKVLSSFKLAQLLGNGYMFGLWGKVGKAERQAAFNKTRRNAGQMAEGLSKECGGGKNQATRTCLHA